MSFNIPPTFPGPDDFDVVSRNSAQPTQQSGTSESGLTSQAAASVAQQSNPADSSTEERENQEETLRQQREIRNRQVTLPAGLLPAAETAMAVTRTKSSTAKAKHGKTSNPSGVSPLDDESDYPSDSSDSESSDSSDKNAKPRHHHHHRRRVGVAMEMPASRYAPHFKGKHLQRFLSNYEIATEEAGWSDRRRCAKVHDYCSTGTRGLVYDLAKKVKDSWPELKAQMKTTFGPESWEHRSTLASLEKFAKTGRKITNLKELAIFYRRFLNRARGLSTEITPRELNLLFFRSLPRTLQETYAEELKVRQPGHSLKVPKPVEEVYKLCVYLLEPNSIFSNKFTREVKLKSHSKSKLKSKTSTKSSRSKKSKHSKRHRYDSDSSDSESDDETSDSEDESSDNSSSESSDDSRSETSDDESEDESTSDDDDAYRRKKSSSSKSKRHREHKSKHRSRRTKSPGKKDIGHRSRSSDSNRRSKSPAEGTTVAELADQLHKMALVVQRAPSTTPISGAPDGIIQALGNLAQGLQATQNTTQMLLDQRRPRRERDQSRPTRCFMCKREDDHPRGYVNCPEAKILIKEGYLVVRDGRVVMPDGSELPKVDRSESLPAVIRRLHGPGGRRQANPLVTAFVGVALSEGESDYDEEEEEEDYSENYQASNYNAWDSMAAERNERAVKSVRFDPTTRDKRTSPANGNQPSPGPSQSRTIPAAKINGRPRMEPYVEITTRPRFSASPQPGKQAETTSNQAPEQAKRMPLNSEERFAASSSKRPPEPVRVPLRQVENQQPRPAPTPSGASNRDKSFPQHANMRNKDFEIRPNPGPARIIPPSVNPGIRSEFTTNLRMMHKPKDVLNEILGAEVKLDLGKLLAVSPDLVKILNMESRSHRVPITSIDADGGVTFHGSAVAGMYYDRDETPMELDDERVAMSQVRRSESQLAYNAYEARADYREEDQNEGPSAKEAPVYRTASTGSFRVSIEHLKNLIAMVDTGAEMCLVPLRVAVILQKYFPIDTQAEVMKVTGVAGKRLEAKRNVQ